MALTPRERVLLALSHEEPDRVPIVLGASNATSLQMGAYRRLKAHLGIQAPDCYLYDWPELGTAALDEQTLQHLQSDVRGVQDRFPQAVLERNAALPPQAPRFDDWGVGRTQIQEGVWFPSIHPLAEATAPEDLERYPWPDMNDPQRVAHVHEQAQRLANEGRYAILGVPWLLFPFERAIALQGMEKFLVNMVRHPDFAQALLLKVADLCRTLMGHFLEAMGENIDIIKIGDDLGGQNGLLISPALYRRMLKPIHADYIAFIKQRTRAKVFFHSDGDIFDLLDDLVEIGVDILNPLQTTAGKMANLAELKRRYGKNLVFCGGIDTQRLLPFGSPQEVRQEVRRVIEHLAPGGGYFLAAVHTILDDTPPKNILAMVEAALEFGRYR